MNRLLRQAFVAELAPSGRASFGFGFWHSFDQSDWSRALDWLDVSGLALYFRRKLLNTDGVQLLPSSVQARLARSHEQNCLRIECIRKESLALHNLFENAGVEYAVLKGLALVPDYCPDATLRTQYDHDYLIRPGALARAEAALQQAGYRPKVSREGYHITYIPPVPEGDSRAGPVGLYSARLQRSVELHIRLWENTEERIDIPLGDDLMDRLRNRFGLGLEYPALCDEDGLMFQVLHAFRHILRNWCRLSVFYEISHFLHQRAADPAFWTRYQDRIANLRWVPEISTLVFNLTQSLFGSSTPPEYHPRVDPRFSAIAGAWIDLYGLPGALANFRGNKNGLFLHREFVKDRSEWAEVRRRRLFPFRRPHQLPSVLFNHGPSGSTRRLTQHLHSIRRLKFHALSAIRYAWEYPRWQFHRRVPILSGPTAEDSMTLDSGNRDSELSLEPAVTHVHKTSLFRD
ncbi:MAG TPA: nucleotidyltransferase family protein [Terriglobia bacterium]|nr:nucleotidyltransferase family protein [Terriglobia bacterium]